VAVFKVGIGQDGSLYALEAGKVIVTCEKFEPNFNKFWTERTYSERKGNMNHVYKKYFHVIPDPLEPKFKLIDQI
jgi:large subunit ribosomal protein L27